MSTTTTRKYKHTQMQEIYVNVEEAWRKNQDTGFTTNLAYFTDKEVNNTADIRHFVLDSSDQHFIRGLDKQIITNLQTYMRHFRKRRIYLRYVTREFRGESIRRVLADEVLEIVPLVLKLQGIQIDLERLADYREKWRSDSMDYEATIDLPELHIMLEDFDVNKALITLINDTNFDFRAIGHLLNGTAPIYIMNQKTQPVVFPFQAVYHIFQSTAFEIDWVRSSTAEKPEEVERLRLEIIECMQKFQAMDPNMLIQIKSVDAHIRYLRNQFHVATGIYMPNGLSALQFSDCPCDAVMPILVYRERCQIYGIKDFTMVAPDNMKWVPISIARVWTALEWAEVFLSTRERAPLMTALNDFMIYKKPFKLRSLYYEQRRRLRASLTQQPTPSEDTKSPIPSTATQPKGATVPEEGPNDKPEVQKDKGALECTMVHTVTVGSEQPKKPDSVESGPRTNEKFEFELTEAQMNSFLTGSIRLANTPGFNLGDIWREGLGILNPTLYTIDHNDMVWMLGKCSSDPRDISELCEQLKSLEGCLKYRPEKRIYVRTFKCVENGVEVRRVLADECLQVIPLLLERQGNPIQKDDDRLRKYRERWLIDDTKNPSKLTTTITVTEISQALGEFEIKNALAFEDLTYKLACKQMSDYGNTPITFLNHQGEEVMFMTHAILFLVDSLILGFDWNKNGKCEEHEDCIAEYVDVVCDCIENLGRKDKILIRSQMIKNVIDEMQFVHKCWFNQRVSADEFNLQTFKSSDKIPLKTFQEIIKRYKIRNVDSSKSVNADQARLIVFMASLKSFYAVAGRSVEKFEGVFVDAALCKIRPQRRGCYRNLRLTTSESSHAKTVKKDAEAPEESPNQEPDDVTADNYNMVDEKSIEQDHQFDHYNKLAAASAQRKLELAKRKEAKKKKDGKIAPMHQNPKKLAEKELKKQLTTPVQTPVKPKNIEETANEDQDTDVWDAGLIFNCKCDEQTSGEEEEEVEQKLEVDLPKDDTKYDFVRQLYYKIVSDERRDENSEQGSRKDSESSVSYEYQASETDRSASESPKPKPPPKRKTKKAKKTPMESQGKTKVETHLSRNCTDCARLQTEIRNLRMANAKISASQGEIARKLDQMTDTAASYESMAMRTSKVESEMREMEKVMLKEKQQYERKLAEQAKHTEENVKLRAKLKQRKEIENQLRASNKELASTSESLKQEVVSLVEKSQADKVAAANKQKKLEAKMKAKSKDFALKSDEFENQIAILTVQLQDASVEVKDMERLRKINKALLIQNSKYEEDKNMLTMQLKSTTGLNSSVSKDASPSSSKSTSSIFTKKTIPSNPLDPLQELRRIRDDYEDNGLLKEANGVLDNLKRITTDSKHLSHGRSELLRLENVAQVYMDTVEQNIRNLARTQDFSKLLPLPILPSLSTEFMSLYSNLMVKLSSGIPDTDCLICHGPREDGDSVVKCEICKKTYHREPCALDWFKKSRTCPYCRTRLLDSTEYPELGVSVKTRKRS